MAEDGAETVEIIIGIVVFVIFGLTVFGMIMNTAGIKSSKIANCITNYEDAEIWWEYNHVTNVNRCNNGAAGWDEIPNSSYNG